MVSRFKESTLKVRHCGGSRAGPFPIPSQSKVVSLSSQGLIHKGKEITKAGGNRIG